MIVAQGGEHGGKRSQGINARKEGEGREEVGRWWTRRIYRSCPHGTGVSDVQRLEVTLP